MTDQLKVGVALMALSRIALTDAHANARMGRAYNEAFSRQLAKHPKLEAVYGHTRAAALWCVENWTDVQAYLAKLERENPAKLQVLGVRGLRDAVSAEINAAHHANEMPEPREPGPRRFTPAERLNLLLLALRHTGQAYEEEEGRIRVLNKARFRQYIREEDEPIQTGEPEAENKPDGAAAPSAPKRLPPPDTF